MRLRKVLNDKKIMKNGFKIVLEKDEKCYDFLK